MFEHPPDTTSGRSHRCDSCGITLTIDFRPGKVKLQCRKCGGQKFRKFGFFKNRNGEVQRYACNDCGKTASISNNNGMRLEKAKIALTIKMLCESSGIRQTSRIVGIHQDTVLKILKIAGTIAHNFMDEKSRNLKCKIVVADEIHSYVNTRDHAMREKQFGKGTFFTFFSVCQDSKFIINTMTDARQSHMAERFLKGLKSRVPGRFQLNTDAWRPYTGSGKGRNSVKQVFGEEIDHVTEEKVFCKAGPFAHRTLSKVKRRRRIGFPDIEKASTSTVERTNLNLRHFSRRFTRCTIAFSKKLINHRLAVDLFIWHSNFSRKHLSLKTTPAIAIGLPVAIMKTEDLWNMEIGNN